MPPCRRRRGDLGGHSRRGGHRGATLPWQQTPDPQQVLVWALPPQHMADPRSPVAKSWASCTAALMLRVLGIKGSFQLWPCFCPWTCSLQLRDETTDSQQGRSKFVA